MDYERVIGLEVHCELKTNSKMFSASPVTFGEDPNTMINEVDMGMTGTLPCLNKRGVELRFVYVMHYIWKSMNYYALTVRTTIILTFQKVSRLLRIKDLSDVMVI